MLYEVITITQAGLLLGCLALTGWWASGGGGIRFSGKGILSWVIVITSYSIHYTKLYDNPTRPRMVIPVSVRSGFMSSGIVVHFLMAKQISYNFV